VQPMLLRVLETGTYRPLGASSDASTSARLIAATDQKLDGNGFNQPLLRRMESFVIRVPPLRERREDIGVLLLEALRACAGDAAEMAAFPPALVSEMCNYDWPGNIRQLVNVTRRALMARRAGEVPTLAQFVELTRRPEAAAQSPAQVVEKSEAVSRRRLSEIGPDDLLLAMEENGWQISGAAQQLAVSRPSLYKLIEAHPAIRGAAAIPAAEIATAWQASGADLTACAAALKTPSEALRRHLRVLGLDRQDSLS
jgi:DNA-binding NtrC family response regulator